MLEIEGSLIDCSADYIVHQENCQSERRAGLAKTLCSLYPDLQEFVNSSPNRKPGEIDLFQTGTTIIVNLYGQNRPGFPSLHLETKEQREIWFCRGLEKLTQILRSRYEKDQTPREVAFPYGIGCGLAGGTWSRYRKMIEEFEVGLQNYQVKVTLIRLPNQPSLH